MLINELINSLVEIITAKIDDYLPKKYYSIFQDYLEKNGVIRDPSNIIAINLMVILSLSILSIFITLIFNINFFILLLIAIIFPPSFLITYIIISAEKRTEEIEKSTPDFLRQLSAMLRAGMSFETALLEFSNYGSGPLHDEIKRVTLEMKMGKDFNSSLMLIPKRLNSQNLNRTFKIIIDGRKTGGGLSDIIDSVAEDLRATLELKKERKSNVMMSVMFLIISAVIAAPFTLGMVGVYSTFLISLGKETELVKVAISAAGYYIIIHSSLVGFIIGIILYGDFKKGLKYSIPLVILSYGIFYVISRFGVMFLGIKV
jgi:flagellar protein FlaJ